MESFSNAATAAIRTKRKNSSARSSSSDADPHGSGTTRDSIRDEKLSQMQHLQGRTASALVSSVVDRNLPARAVGMVFELELMKGEIRRNSNMFRSEVMREKDLIICKGIEPCLPVSTAPCMPL
jgi:hypothetical protein